MAVVETAEWRHVGRPCHGSVVVRRLAPFVLLVALAACGSDQDPAMDIPQTTAPLDGPAGTGATDEVVYEIDLTGDAEVPEPGDPDGSGRAVLRLVSSRSEVCYEITVEGIDPPASAHIHRGRAGESGPVVLDLAPPSQGAWVDCSAGNQVLLQELATDPAGFYVNVHNQEFPQGALRGQLS